MRPGHDPLGRLALPVLAYLSVVSLAALGSAGAAFVVGLLLAATPLVLVRFPERAPSIALLPLVAMGAVLVGGITSGFLLVAPWDALLGGILCGLPLGVLGVLQTGLGDPTSRFLLLVAALWEGLGLRAAGGSSPGAMGGGFLRVQLQQVGGLGAWSGGAGSPILPLASVNDPIFLGLALLALGGALLAMLRSPVTDGIVAAQREGDLWLVVAALAAGALFEVLALGAPRFALLGLALAVVVLVGALLLVGSRRGSAWLARLLRRLGRGRLSSNLPD
ncbi:MAG TPA: hypothetical protein VGU43_04470 [Thermoplasmata archaeon]|nr:hypothetical protein [Thermoplasmata archaeon]